ncbi:MAG: metallophosphoesterase [Deltaproteobacteria bacterium]|nr:metallophosphoesterase [Deltaproteobacteria bacterium]
MTRLALAAWGGLFLIGSWPASALAEPRWIRVSLTEDPAHGVFVSWNDTLASQSVVQYGLDSNYGQTASGTHENVGGDLEVIHSVRLDGLEPDTTYHYRVGDPSVGWSQDQSFSTAPADACAPFSFGIAADNRGNLSGTSLCWETVYERIAAEGVDFVINSGDLVHEGKNDNEWADFLETSAFQMASLPIVPALGNHDDDDVDGDGALYNQVFTLPRNPVTGTEDFYSFDYGNTHFVCLSTHTFKDDAYQQQLEWLAQDLAATDKMWKVVFFHVPVYSSGSHGTNEDGKNPYLIPVLDAHHVDLVITGHDHIYERYRPMHNGQEVASYDEGTCYMVSGGGGAATDPIYAFRAKEPGLEASDNLHHFVKITVANNVMHIRAERVSGGGCFQGGEGVIDEFSIVKTLQTNPCAGPTDSDGDGFSPPTDCNDEDASVHPGAEEICGDEIDQDCDGQDLACPCADEDGDGFGAQPCGNDCDDGDADSHPGAVEVCADGKDQDCDGQTDEVDCQDCTDNDGDGVPAASANCPSGTDCDDSDADIYPGAEERCNERDDDCDGQTDEESECAACVDADGDLYYAANQDCPGAADCDDTNAQVHPSADERCNGIDDDCDAIIDEDLGMLSCGTGACANTVPACADGLEVRCAPREPPEQREMSCADGVDNDCDGYTDQDDGDCRSSGCGCESVGGVVPWAGLLCLAALGVLLGLRRRLSP